MFDDLIRSLFSISFTFLDININIGDVIGTITQLANFSVMSKKSVFSLASSCYNVVKPVGLSLLGLFIMIKFIKEAMEVSKITWERIVMIAIEFLFYKFLIDNSFSFLTTIMNICSELFTKVSNVIAVNSINTSQTIGDALAEFCSGNMIQQALLMIVVFMLWIGIIGTLVGVVVQIIMTFVKIILGFAVSPIPIAMGLSESGGSNTTKTFIMWIVSLGLEYILMMICAKIYSVGLGTIDSSLGGVLGIFFANTLLLAMISSCSTLAEKFTGGR